MSLEKEKNEYLDGLKNTEKHSFSESNKSISTISTISTLGGSRGKSSALASALTTKSADYTELKDSKLSELLAEKLSNILVIDEVTSEWYQRQNDIWKPITKNRATKIINSALHELLPLGFSISKLNAIEGFLKLYLALDHWEQNKALLPLKNGILDTYNGTLKPYSEQHKFNWQLPYEYDKKAEIKTIKRWLWETTNQDLEAINIIRGFFKISLVGDGLQKFLEIVGPGGTGKSTLIRLLIMLIGETNCTATDLKNLEQNRFEAATLYGKRLAVISDSSRYGGEVSVLKAITGGDPVRHEKKNQQQSGSFVFNGVVVIASNEAIQSTDYSSGLARRRLPILFVKKITNTDKEKWRSLGGIENVMRKELPGFLNWVLAMPDDELSQCLNSIDGKLSNAQRQHLVETNKLANWLDDNLVIDTDSVLYIGGNIKAIKDEYKADRECKEKLYPNYIRWCDENGVNPLAVQRFSNNLIDISEHCKLPVKQANRDSKGRRIKGLKIRAISDLKHKTPITEILLNRDKFIKSADECRSSADTKSSTSRVSADGADSADKNLFQDTEVF